MGQPQLTDVGGGLVADGDRGDAAGVAPVVETRDAGVGGERRAGAVDEQRAAVAGADVQLPRRGEGGPGEDVDGGGVERG